MKITASVEEARERAQSDCAQDKATNSHGGSVGVWLLSERGKARAPAYVAPEHAEAYVTEYRRRSRLGYRLT
jgi:hypothetical protein